MKFLVFTAFAFSIKIGWQRSACDRFVTLSCHEGAFPFHLQQHRWTN